MVKRGGKEVITVEIFKETYDAMKVIATRKRWSAKEYINTVLVEAIEKDKFLQSYAPSLSKVGYEDDILFIRDAKLGKTAEIYLRDRALYCNVCESKDCVHIHYALALPEVAKLYLRRLIPSTKSNKLKGKLFLNIDSYTEQNSKCGDPTQFR